MSWTDQFSPLTKWGGVGGLGGRDMTGNSAEIVFQFFSAGGHCDQFWQNRQGCPPFDIVHAAFPQLTIFLCVP